MNILIKSATFDLHFTCKNSYKWRIIRNNKQCGNRSQNPVKQACRGILSLFISIFQKLSQNIDFRRFDEK